MTEVAELLKQHTETVQAGIDEMKTKAAGHGARLDEIEQLIARGGSRAGGGDETTASWGSQFVGDDRVKAFAQRSPSSGLVDMRIKATITSATANAAGSAGGLIVPQRDTLVPMPQRRMTIRQLLDVRNVGMGNAVEYPRQVSHATGADMVAEGAAKPQSDLQFELVTAPIKVIAHWVKASKQVLDDAPQLKGTIDQELIYGLALKEEAQLLSGDGTGQNLQGMIPQATAYSAPVSIADLNQIDVIGLAILQASLTNLPPDGIVIHPADWWAMRLLKDAQGRYILGDPQSVTPPALFGLPVVPTEAMTARKFLVGAYGAQTLYDRWEARVEVGFINDDFTQNLVTVLGEERVGFAAKQPASLIYGDFDTALAA